MSRCARGLYLLSLLVTMSVGQEPTPPTVAIKGKIVEAGAPIQLVAETDVQAFDWLEGGRYLVYLRDPFPERESYVQMRTDPSFYQLKRTNALYLYDPTTKRTTPIHQNNIDFWAVVLKGRAVLYVVSEEVARQSDLEGLPAPRETLSSQTRLYLRMPRQGKSQLIAQLNGRLFRLSLSGRLPLSPDGRYVAITWLNPQVLDLQTGRVIRTFEKPLTYAHWTPDSTLCLATYRRGGDAEYALYDVRTDRLTPISKEQYKQLVEKSFEADYRARRSAHLQIEAVRYPNGSQAPAAYLLLQSLEARTERWREAIVAYDAHPDIYSLAPDESGIAYRSWRGQLFYIPLRKREPKTLPEKIACGQEPTQEDIHNYYLSNAKQINLSLLMYCADYDETFPPNSNISELLMPYLRNREVFLDIFTGQMVFTYLMDGQSLASIESPATTPVGGLDWGDPTMVVVLYADGHVKLEPRK